MGYNGLVVFNSAMDKIRQGTQDVQAINMARANLAAKQQAMDIQKKQAALDLDTASMTNQDTALNLKAKKAYMDQMFGTQQDVLDGHQAMIDQQEQKTVSDTKQAHSVAAHLFNTDPDVKDYAISGGTAVPDDSGNTPTVASPAGPAGSPPMSLTTGGTNLAPANNGQAPDQSTAASYKSAGTMTFPGPNGSMVIGGGQGSQPSRAPINPDMGSLFGLNGQQDSGGGQMPAQTAPVTSAPAASTQQGSEVGTTPFNGTKTTDPNLPPLSQVYNGLSKAPFGQATSDIYMKNPNFLEAIKTGNYLIKKDPQMIESANPLALNENDRTVLSDVPQLQKVGYSQYDIFSQLTPGTQSLIKTVGEYRATPAELTSSFGGGRQKQELVKAVQAFYPKWSDAVYDQRHKSLIDFTDPNGINGQTIAATRQGIEHMDELTSSIDAVSNKTISMGLGRQVPVLNAPMNAIMQYVGGDPDILALKQNINAVSEEMTKAWGGARAGEARLANWRATMNATNSPQGWSGLLSKTAKLWDEAAQTRESMFSMAMGGQKMADVLGQGVITPDQKAILERIKGGYTPNNPDMNTTSNIPAGRIGVIGPDGKKYSVPQEQLQQAVQQGYKKI